MACCCQKTLNLCRVSVCGTDQIKTGINAPIQGVYKLELDYLEATITIEQAFAMDAPLNFSSQGLNEKYKYTGKLIGPDGSPLSIPAGEEEEDYDCIAFQTGMQYPMNKVECPAVDPSGWSLPDTTLGAEYFAELEINGSGPYSADLATQPAWLTIELIGNKIRLGGTVPDDEAYLGVTYIAIRAANCARELPDIISPTYQQQINVE